MTPRKATSSNIPTPTHQKAKKVILSGCSTTLHSPINMETNGKLLTATIRAGISDISVIRLVLRGITLKPKLFMNLIITMVKITLSNPSANRKICSVAKGYIHSTILLVGKVTTPIMKSIIIPAISTGSVKPDLRSVPFFAKQLQYSIYIKICYFGH